MIVIDTETNSTDPHTAKLLLITCDHDNKVFVDDGSYCGGALFTGQNAKFDQIVLSKHGINVQCCFDTMVAQYLLAIDQPKKLEKMAQQYLGIEKEDLLAVYNRCTGETRKTLPENWHEKIPRPELEKYALSDAETTYQLAQILKEKLTERPVLRDWFYDVEMPIVNILAEIELRGAKVDTERLKYYGDLFTQQAFLLKQKLFTLAGTNELNLNSSKQLQKVLYDKFKLPKLRKTKTGVSTDTKCLERLSERHVFPKLLLEHRKLEKLISTYCDPLVDIADSNGRIHTNYNQCLTDTRRFSSDSPNLQNIPARSKEGQLIKSCFIPEKGHSFLICDYKQIELALLAHFSKEPILVEALRNKQDVHQLTADLLSKEMGREVPRAYGKLLNFSLIYGKTAFGFSWDWNCSQQEAQDFITLYFKQYTKIKEYIGQVQMRAIQNSGWLETIAGLPLFIEGVHSQDKREYEHAMRCAVNYPIQGSSQDILKLAIVGIKKQLNIVPTLMVHDELVFELPDETFYEQSEKIIKIMESAYALDVPLEVEALKTDRWAKE